MSEQYRLRDQSGLRRVITVLAIGLAATAVVEQLQKPAAERTWHGRVFGMVPYDFRMPTIQMLRDAYWNPENPALFTDKVLGLGWSINFFNIWRGIRSLGIPSRG